VKRDGLYPIDFCHATPKTTIFRASTLHRRPDGNVTRRSRDTTRDRRVVLTSEFRRQGAALVRVALTGVIEVLG